MIRAATTALADDMENVPPVTHPATQKECGESVTAKSHAFFRGQDPRRIRGAWPKQALRASRCVQGIGERRVPSG
jgi:hypothetical protein